MLGITQEELERYSVGHIAVVAEGMGISREEVIKGLKEWYDGGDKVCIDEAAVSDKGRQAQGLSEYGGFDIFAIVI